MAATRPYRDAARAARAAVAVLAAAALVAAVVGAVLLRAGTRVRATSLVQVSAFGSNPGALDMYVYRPDGLPVGAPVVVALHGCTQTAEDYWAHSGWPALADARRFALVLPQQRTGNNLNRCFTWFAPTDTARGEGEAASIAAMLDHAVQTYRLDADRAYVTGLSAGGGMTAVMLAAYPDRFAGGAVVAGLPYRCATDVRSASGCMADPGARTPAQWGDLVRAASPGYERPRPPVAIWHGTADATVDVRNAEAGRDQWTDVLGVDRVADDTATLPGNGEVTTVRTAYADGAGRVAVQDNRVAGLGHGTPVDPTVDCGSMAPYFLSAICSSAEIAAFWGLAEPA